MVLTLIQQGLGLRPREKRALCWKMEIIYLTNNPASPLGDWMVSSLVFLSTPFCFINFIRNLMLFENVPIVLSIILMIILNF